MLIGVDMDEVLADFAGTFIEFLNDRYKAFYTRKDLTSYKFWEVLGCKKEEGIQIVKDFFETPYYKRIPPVEDSLDSIAELKKFHELIIVTSRQERVRDETKRWLKQYFPNTFSEIYFSNNHYTKTGGDISKSDICRMKKVDLLIDDSLEYALDCQNNVSVFLLDQPWNQSEELPDSITRVYGWKDVLKRI